MIGRVSEPITSTLIVLQNLINVSPLEGLGRDAAGRLVLRLRPGGTTGADEAEVGAGAARSPERSEGAKPCGAQQGLPGGPEGLHRERDLRLRRRGMQAFHKQRAQAPPRR